MNKIITISREFGSGGRELGRRLSELLNIAYYDQEIITEIANQTDLAEQYVEHIIEQQQPIVAFPIHTSRSLCYAAPNPVVESTTDGYEGADTDYSGNGRKNRLCYCRPLWRLHFKGFSSIPNFCICGFRPQGSAVHGKTHQTGGLLNRSYEKENSFC